MAKRARELAAREKRERKLAKKAARAAAATAGDDSTGTDLTAEAPDESEAEPSNNLTTTD